MTTASASFVFAALKPRYGGNIKVADELLPDRSVIALFGKGTASGLNPVHYSITDNSVHLDFNFLPPDQFTQLENAIDEIENPTSECHWILDYPNLNHEHANSFSIHSQTLVFKAGDSEFLPELMTSHCMVPAELSILQAFRQTQFGFEANTACIAGRPYLDSLTPVAIDPVNPYLSFKLNDVDMFPVPEDRFQQIQSDPSLVFNGGRKFYLFLKTTGFAPNTANALKAAIHAQELATTVLNNHASILLPAPAEPASASQTGKVILKIPEENPFQLVGKRIRIQMEEAGFQIVDAGQGLNLPTVELVAEAVFQEDQDLFQYLLVKNHFPNRNGTWFEIWDELLSGASLIPLLNYESQTAVRKGIMGIRFRAGIPDFSDAWIYQSP